jgi:hypothetical protein
MPRFYAATPAFNEESMTNEQIIRGAFADFMKRDWEAFASTLADGFTFTTTSKPTSRN